MGLSMFVGLGVCLKDKHLERSTPQGSR